MRPVTWNRLIKVLNTKKNCSTKRCFSKINGLFFRISAMKELREFLQIWPEVQNKYEAYFVWNKLLEMQITFPIVLFKFYKRTTESTHFSYFENFTLKYIFQRDAWTFQISLDVELSSHLVKNYIHEIFILSIFHYCLCIIKNWCC